MQRSLECWINSLKKMQYLDKIMLVLITLQIQIFSDSADYIRLFLVAITYVTMFA